MKRILLLTIFLIVLVLQSAFAATASDNTYENQHYKFRLTLPDNWQAKNIKSGVEFSNRDGSFRSIAIFIGLRPENDHTESVPQEYIDIFTNQILEQNIREHGELRIANRNALWFLSTRANKPFMLAYLIPGKDLVYSVLMTDDIGNLNVDRQLCDKTLSTLELFD